MQEAASGSRRRWSAQPRPPPPTPTTCSATYISTPPAQPSRPPLCTAPQGAAWSAPDFGSIQGNFKLHPPEVGHQHDVLRQLARRDAASELPNEHFYGVASEKLPRRSWSESSRCPRETDAQGKPVTILGSIDHAARTSSNGILKPTGDMVTTKMSPRRWTRATSQRGSRETRAKAAASAC